jgi:hypothetical protein
MAPQLQHNTHDLFNRSNFLAHEIPPVVFAATHYTRLRDVGVNDKRLVSQARELLSLLADEFKNTTRDLPDFLLDICLGQRAVEVGTLSKYANEAPPLIYDAIKERCKSKRYPFFYGDYEVIAPDKAAQRALFRSDVATHLELYGSQIEKLSHLDRDTSHSVDFVAMFLLEFSRRSLNREPEKIKHAESYAKLIAAAQTNPVLTIRLCLQHFTSLLEDRLKPKAAQILARQLASSHPGLAELVTKTATNHPPHGDVPLSQDERHQLITDLQRGVWGDELLLRFLLRPYVIEDVKAIKPEEVATRKEVSKGVSGDTPEWLKTLFINGRLNVLDISNLSRASQRMKEQLGTATTVSVDLGLFSWPRITEIAALTRALDLLINSDLPFSSRGPEDKDHITQATNSALAGKKPNDLPFMALLGSAEEVIAREKKWLQPLGVRDSDALAFSYEADEGVRKANITLLNGTSVQQRISKLLGRDIQAPCFIVEGSRPETPRAFGVWKPLIPGELQNFTVENFGDISLFFNKDAVVLTGRDLRELKLPKVRNEEAQPPAPLPAAATLVAVSDELKILADLALEKASRYGDAVKVHTKSIPVIRLLKQITKGHCPSRRELRIVRSMEHNIRSNVVSGGVCALFEEALPVLHKLAGEVERNRES